MDREGDEMKLKGYKNIEGVIEVVTGLHIGGSTAIIEIGGNDVGGAETGTKNGAVGPLRMML